MFKVSSVRSALLSFHGNSKIIADRKKKFFSLFQTISDWQRISQGLSFERSRTHMLLTQVQRKLGHMKTKNTLIEYLRDISPQVMMELVKGLDDGGLCMKKKYLFACSI